MFKVGYLCNGWVKKDGVNTGLIQYVFPKFTVDSSTDFASALF